MLMFSLIEKMKTVGDAGPGSSALLAPPVDIAATTGATMEHNGHAHLIMHLMPFILLFQYFQIFFLVLLMDLFRCILYDP